jgi:acyl-coenzyme A thioesterase 13
VALRLGYDGGMSEPMNMPLVGFSRALTGLAIIQGSEGGVRARIPVSEAVQNLFGTLHGGAIATLVDDIGTLAIVSADRERRLGVTTDLNVSYFAPGKAGSAILVEAKVLKIGNTLSTVTVDLRREEDGMLIAQGRMTKYLG